MARRPSWWQLNCVARPLRPGLRKLFERRPALPLVRYDPAFAEWQKQFAPFTTARKFQQLRDAIE